MHRRDFLRVTGAAAAFARKLPASQRGATATVLFDDHAVSLDQVLADPGKSKDALWVRKVDLPRINAFELKPQGACRADICIPIPKDMVRGEYFNLTAFARKIGQSVVIHPEALVWSFGEIPVLSGSFLNSRAAPDFAAADRKGHVVRLRAFRGRKVLVVTWASW